jgi:hypothetical protein
VTHLNETLVLFSSIYLNQLIFYFQKDSKNNFVYLVKISVNVPAILFCVRLVSNANKVSESTVIKKINE